MEQKRNDNLDKNENRYLFLGMSLGLLVGMWFHNIGLGMLVGAALGILLDSNQKK